MKKYRLIAFLLAVATLLLCLYALATGTGPTRPGWAVATWGQIQVFLYALQRLREAPAPFSEKNNE